MRPGGREDWPIKIVETAGKSIECCLVTTDPFHGNQCDMWHMTGGGRWTFSQNFSSLALTVWEWRCSEDISTKDDWLSYLMNDEGVCRTAPATPGLLNICLVSTVTFPQFSWFLLFVGIWITEKITNLSALNILPILAFRKVNWKRETEKLSILSYIN